MRKINLVLLAACSVLLFSGFSGCHCGTHDGNGGTACNGATATADTNTTPQDTPKLIDVLANDTNPQASTTTGGTTTGGTQLTIASVVSPTAKGGTAVISGNQILYTPPAAPTSATSTVKNISTGIDDATGTKFAEGVVDTDYTIAAGGTAGHAGETMKTLRTSIPQPPVWLVDNASPASAWIVLNLGDNSNASPGSYFLETTVDATGFDPATLQIVGLNVTADNRLESISINGVSVFSTPTGNDLYTSFLSLGDVGLGQFQAGINTIRFVFTNIDTDNNPMGLRVEGVVQSTSSAGPTAPFADTFNYTINNLCGGTSTATVTVNVTDPAAAAALATAAPAKVLIVNNSSAEITVFVGGTEVDVVQPRGTTIAPRYVASGANQQIRVEALSADPQANASTSNTAELQPDGAYTITYTDTGNGSPTISVTE